MNATFEQQLALNFSRRTKKFAQKKKTASDRVIENIRKERRVEYFQRRKTYFRDSFLSFRGCSIF